MRAWPLHAVFATLLVGSLAAKSAAEAPVDPADFEPAVTRVARSHGLAFRGYETLTGTDVRAMVFEAPGCSRPVLVVVLPIFLDQEAMLDFGSELDNFVTRYVYIDRSWEKPHRLALYVERMKYAVLKTLRLTRYHPDSRMLLVNSPLRCQAADAIDWRNVWNRDYVDAARG